MEVCIDSEDQNSGFAKKGCAGADATVEISG
jgi:hypothetical protein